ncbi:MAG: preQ(1) synthase [Candidatus Helarchaeales archaeon]
MNDQNQNDDLTHLKKNVVPQKYTYDPTLLERFKNKYPNRNYWVSLVCFEFTSLCPITGQPDFATILINYIPDEYLVESKSLKLYLLSYRNEGAFNEDLTNRILDDLVKLLAPKFIEVFSEFNSRGGISILPYVNCGKGAEWEAFAKQRLLEYQARNIQTESEPTEI